MNSLISGSSTYLLGGDFEVNRVGYGAMALTGPGAWGEPRDPEEAVRVLRRAVESGVNLIDTADCYGPFVSDGLIRKALHPYPQGLVIATKVGLVRPSPTSMVPLGRPEYLRQQVELSLRHLGLERIDLLQLHRIDPTVPLADQIGEFVRLQNEGKIRHIGLSQVSVDELKAAQAIAPIASVQNLYNLVNRDAEALVDYSHQQGIAFFPFWPLGKGTLAGNDANRVVAGPQSAGSVHLDPLAQIADRLGATTSQVALAWLLRRSPNILPIPGTSRVSHLEENLAAAQVSLSDDDFQTLLRLS
jgi:aryl-alcohol dehydrogenase-like predicted oxidoreductase